MTSPVRTHTRRAPTRDRVRHRHIQHSQDDVLCVVLTVSGTGHGMDPDTLSRIFEPFSTTQVRRRSGLGLSAVYGIIRQSGGQVEAVSEPGRGTTFRLCFKPADEKSASHLESPIPSAKNA